MFKNIFKSITAERRCDITIRKKSYKKIKDTKASLHKHLYACKRFNSANEFFIERNFFHIFTSKQLSRLRITLCLLIMTEKKGIMLVWKKLSVQEYNKHCLVNKRGTMMLCDDKQQCWILERGIFVIFRREFFEIIEIYCVNLNFIFNFCFIL